MVLHKQLRVLSRGTPCVIMDFNSNFCAYSGASDEILARLTSIQSKYRNSFVKEVKLINEDDASYKDYGTSHKSFVKIIVKCKEDKLNENQGK